MSRNYKFHNIDYIHNNPIESGFVTELTEWKYRSTRIFAEDQTVMKIDAISFLG